jgi:hypothetical protein
MVSGEEQRQVQNTVVGNRDAEVVEQKATSFGGVSGPTKGAPDHQSVGQVDNILREMKVDGSKLTEAEQTWDKMS